MIKIQKMDPVLEGDVVRVSVLAPKGTRGVEATVAKHGAHESVTLELRQTGQGVLTGSFRPDRPGRWWVSARQADTTVEACVWATARQVPSV